MVQLFVTGKGSGEVSYRIPPFQPTSRYKVSFTSMSLSPAIKDRCRYLGERTWQYAWNVTAHARC